MNGPVQIGSKKLNISSIGDVALRLRKVGIDTDALKRLKKNFEYLKKQSEQHVIYGLNTGFGPMAHIFISKEKKIELQYNLIRSHAVALGNAMDASHVRAIMAIRLQTLLKSHSAIDESACRLLAEFLNRGITPVVYVHGSVGASGDLVQLAHIAEALIGEGRVTYKGRIMSTKEVFSKVLRKVGTQPLQVKLREGLALMNGTSAMTGIGALNVYHARILLQYSLLASSAMFEIVQASEEYFSKEISDVRPHAGQVRAGEAFRKILKTSKLIRREDVRLAAGLKKNDMSKAEAVDSNTPATTLLDQSRQEIYSIRCAVQILGPIFDALTQAEKIVETEMNSVTDNPITFTDGKVIHGGNFHGDYVSFEMDKLKIAITKLSILSERKLNFLVNDKVNKTLPPFLNTGTVGLDLGLQGLQFVATSTVAENQSLSMPVSIHSISCNNDNQDIVSMGTNSALIADKVIMNAFDVVAIELVAIQRAVAILGIEDKLSVSTKEFYKKISACMKGGFEGKKVQTDLIRRDCVQAVVDMMKATEVSPEAF